MTSITAATSAASADGTSRSNGQPAVSPCPAWCAYGPHEPLDDVHVGEGHPVPVADMRHICDYTAGEGGAEACEHDICAELVLSEDGIPQVQLHHGYGELTMPPMTLTAAEDLGRILRKLARQGQEQPAVRRFWKDAASWGLFPGNAERLGNRLRDLVRHGSTTA